MPSDNLTEHCQRQESPSTCGLPVLFWNPLHIDQERRLLDGSPCTFQQYLEIPSSLGDYEIRNGVLHKLEMVDGHHFLPVVLLQTHFEERKRAGRVQHVSARSGASIGVGSVRDALKPDLAIGKPCTEVGKPTFTDGYPAYFVLEVTSGNRHDDYDKAGLYSRFGVHTYWIVDRTRKKLVCYDQLADGDYRRSQTFNQDKSVRHEYFGTVKVRDIFNCPQADNISTQNAARERRRLNRSRRLADESRSALQQALTILETRGIAHNIREPRSDTSSSSAYSRSGSASMISSPFRSRSPSGARESPSRRRT